MKYRSLFMTLAAVLTVTAAGCGKKEEPPLEAAPTPAVTATPTPEPTPTPQPTPTPAPRVIGIKNQKAKFIYLANATDKEWRKIYVMASDGEEDWGRNLIPTESSVQKNQRVQMFYQPADGENAAYHLKFEDRDGNEYVVYGAELGDMERASLKIDEDGTAYLQYMSLSAKKETSTKGNESDYNNYDNDDSEEWDYILPDNNDYDNGGDDSYDNGSYPDDGYDGAGDDTASVGDGTGDEDGGYDEGGDDYDNGGDGSYDGGDDGGSAGVVDEGNGSDDIIWDEDGNWSEG